VLLASLPPMPIVRTAAEAAAFLRERLAQSVARAV